MNKQNAGPTVQVLSDFNGGTLALIALACVNRMYSDHVAFGFTPCGSRVTDAIDGLNVEELQSRCGTPRMQANHSHYIGTL